MARNPQLTDLLATEAHTRELSPEEGDAYLKLAEDYMIAISQIATEKSPLKVTGDNFNAQDKAIFAIACSICSSQEMDALLQMGLLTSSNVAQFASNVLSVMLGYLLDEGKITVVDQQG